MGAIITTFVIGLGTGPSGGSMITAALVGNLGAVVGSIVSTRLMIRFTKKEYGTTAPAIEADEASEGGTDGVDAVMESPSGSSKGIGLRLIESTLSGGKSGVKIGLEIIPGVLIICSLVLMLTNGPSPDGTYTGAAFEA